MFSALLSDVASTSESRCSSTLGSGRLREIIIGRFGTVGVLQNAADIL